MNTERISAPSAAVAPIDSAASVAPVSPTMDQDVNMNEFDPMELSAMNLTDEEEEEVLSPLVPEATSTRKEEVGAGNNSELDEDEDLINLYEKKIRQLFKKQLFSEDADELVKNNQLIKQLKLSIQQLKNDEAKVVTQNVPTKINQKRFDVPFFQLNDDPSACKSENKPSYDNAETFVSMFEMILKTNDVDINKDWKKYLAKSFLYSKNDKHHRWYSNFINPLSENTKWNEIKEKLIDRFGNSANMANNIEKYLDLRQGQQESIRDYVDRYLETYLRLPNSKQPSDAIEAMKFIKSLLPKAREEVTNSLKKNKRQDSDSYLPNTLHEVFRYLEKNIGDIQEALYLAVTTSATNKRSYSNVEGFESKKRALIETNNYEYQNKKLKEDKLCIYCKKANFNFEHLKTCVDYLKSDKYKQFLLKQAERRKQQ